jgi:branched-chain amino acid transport system permease protein
VTNRFVLLGVAVFAVLLPFVLSGAQLATATFVVIAAIGATGLNIVTGYAGQISLGHAAFLGVGAYTGAVLGADHGLSAFIWIPAAGVVAALLGAIVGPLALRLRGLYLAIVTLGLVFIAQHVFFNADGLTGGPQGRAFPAVQLGSFDFSPGQELAVGSVTIDSSGLYYFLGLILLAAATAFAWNLRRTRSGRAMVALREREAAAAVMGIDVGRLKVTAFVVSSAMAGVSGALYGSYLSFAQPGQWSLLLSIQFIAAIIVGGLGTTAGPVLGCAVVFALPSLLKELPFLPEEGSGGLSAGDLTSITYGLLIVAFLTLEPRGIVGIANRLRRTGNGSDVGSRASKLTVTTPEEAHP